MKHDLSQRVALGEDSSPLTTLGLNTVHSFACHALIPLSSLSAVRTLTCPFNRTGGKSLEAPRQSSEISKRHTGVLTSSSPTTSPASPATPPPPTTSGTKGAVAALGHLHDSLHCLILQHITCILDCAGRQWLWGLSLMELDLEKAMLSILESSIIANAELVHNIRRKLDHEVRPCADQPPVVRSAAWIQNEDAPGLVIITYS
mmetsp:Transcript_49171/g.76720  ORF Transcript_49171/g.76720 Transcript_49171/m.76720 type:complete len:203 (-) Transcript_49171:65-673(-)